MIPKETSWASLQQERDEEQIPPSDSESDAGLPLTNRKQNTERQQDPAGQLRRSTQVIHPPENIT